MINTFYDAYGCIGPLWIEISKRDMLNHVEPWLVSLVVTIFFITIVQLKIAMQLSLVCLVQWSNRTKVTLLNHKTHPISYSQGWGGATCQRIMGLRAAHLTDLDPGPIVEIRRSYDRLISTMKFPILVRWHLYIESGPLVLNMRILVNALASPGANPILSI